MRQKPSGDPVGSTRQPCVDEIDPGIRENLRDAVGGLGSKVGSPGNQEVIVARVLVDAVERLKDPEAETPHGVEETEARRAMSSSHGSTASSSRDHAASVGSTYP